ncbi:MAG TPA: hypothetical protein VHE35_13325, partial [Kofleriaceae bacterium]|nr:hypothetical protein [Kofleriaceae bacterium]
MIPFAGLAPDERTSRGSGELSALDVAGAVALGAQIRRACRRATTTEQVASVVVDALNSFDHDARPACGLGAGLVRGAVAGAPLRRVATRGLDPAWNDVE